ncbi:MAG: HAMP domain-containing protein [Candidatus Kapaibacterium sp.]|nr:MAG: HAMP domain-containing protein [Candidatus Kapabacteria bacterium]
MKFLRYLSIGKKFALVIAGFAIPIAVLLFFFIQESKKGIDFAAKEIEGTAYLRPLRGLLGQFSYHRLYAERVQSGDGTAQDNLMRTATNVRTLLAELQEADKKYAESLSIGARSANLIAKWNLLASKVSTMTSEESQAEHDALIADVRTLIVWVGDKSNLILDPDLDTYYVMDVMLIRMMDFTDLRYQALLQVERAVRRGAATANERADVKVLLVLMSAHLVGIETDFATAYDNNTLANLKPSLDANLRVYLSTQRSLIGTLQEKYVQSEVISIAQSDIEELTKMTSGVGNKLWYHTTDELDTLLYERISGFRTKLYVNLAVVIIIVLAVLLIVMRITRDVKGAIDNLVETAHHVETGNLAAQSNVLSKDELGELATSVNTMIFQIRRGINDLQAEKAGIQQKVDEAVHDSEQKREYLAKNTQVMLKEMDRFAKGDLTVRLHHDKQDDVGALFEGFTSAAQNVRNIIEKMHETVSVTAAASTEIAANVSEMSSGARRQMSEVTSVVSAIAQMSQSINDNSRQAIHVSSAAQDAGRLATESGVILAATTRDINAVATIVERSSGTVRELGTQSQQIGEIIQVINEIADQTNLLALNAAIEAARAGEQGRGFAVVADEVRKLAERTTSATKQIAEMIQHIQEATEDAVDSINQGMNEVQRSRESANRAQYSMDAIISRVNEVASSIYSLAAASEEQSHASDEVLRNAEVIQQITEQNSSGLAQINLAIENLSHLAINLERMLGQFNIGFSAHKQQARVVQKPTTTSTVSPQIRL